MHLRTAILYSILNVELSTNLESSHRCCLIQGYGLWYRRDMKALDQLTVKVKRVAEEIVSLKKENKALVSEIDLLQKEMQTLQSMKREYDQLKRNEERLKTKLEKIDRRLEELLAGESATLTAQELAI